MCIDDYEQSTRATHSERHAALLSHGILIFSGRQLDTLQHLRHTEKMLRETARVGRVGIVGIVGIVSFPNFAHWRNRLNVATGRMPVTRALPYQWYDTPSIRVGTHADFEVLARKDGLTTLDSVRHPGRQRRAALAEPAGQRGWVFKFERG